MTRPAWIELLEEQLSEIQDLGHDVFVGMPETEEAIASLESALGVALPTSYRDLVATYGWLELGGLAIFGLERAEVQTLAARSMFGLPERCVVVHELAERDAVLCLDTARRDDGGESALVLFEPTSQRVSSEPSTLSEWVAAMVAAELRGAREAG